jgi:PAS domain-containing protein
MYNTINLGEIWIGEIKNKAKDGDDYWIHTSIIPFKNDEGIITEFLYIKQDITRNKLKKLA